MGGLGKAKFSQKNLLLIICDKTWLSCTANIAIGILYSIGSRHDQSERICYMKVVVLCAGKRKGLAECEGGEEEEEEGEGEGGGGEGTGGGAGEREGGESSIKSREYNLPAESDILLYLIEFFSSPPSRPK